MERYSIIPDKNPREIVLLRGSGCRWRQCTFCDYHLDSSTDEAANNLINFAVLDRVTGIYHHLEVINSGSFPELGEACIQKIEQVCQKKDIHLLHFECHYLYRKAIPALRKRFAKIGVELKIKIGVETFDADYRENIMKKGIRQTDPAKIAEDFNECCLLFDWTGQTVSSMRHDIETGLAHFERVCVNIMVPNTTCVMPDTEVIAAFRKEIYPDYIQNPRVDILLENTDFGVGGEEK